MINTTPKQLIHILPPQLANQIAAGEVVERPASVVKELVENSLDAGANTIQIDIEKGGSQLIRIRDNGCGISKQDLPLALARHATSKISSLEDLEAILSLGFRGEALASISSVSRLTLTSRTAEQTEAWQAYAQGREMAVEIQPASHPIGTTIEVANLFFNTPARRKFLRTDKTEFAHIDEVVRRIALAKPNISFSLSHNGKIVRQYRKVQDNSVEQQQKRVAAICGDEFIQHSTYIDRQHGDLHLHGWVGSPALARLQNDLCYSYVNGRMMRDKTINHAIRQAYGDSIASGYYPAFVIFLDLDPTMVDVNVHPAKHEVRFHQGRLVHDFILQGVLNSLQQTQPTLELRNEVNEPLPSYVQDTNRQAAGQNIFVSQTAPQAAEFTQKNASRSSYTPKFERSNSVSSSAQKWYKELVGGDLHQTTPTIKTQSTLVEPKTEPQTEHKTEAVSQKITQIAPLASHHSQALAIVKNQAVLIKEEENFYLLPLATLAELKLKLQLEKGQSQALLIPLNLSLDQQQTERWQQTKEELTKLGFSISEKQWQAQTRLTVLSVPQAVREQNLQQLLFALFNQTQAVNLAEFFAKKCEKPTACTLSDVIALLSEIELYANGKKELEGIRKEVDFSKFL
ncbi:TPA: DNA mismatch repair endonuclease MutL [Mannheimia haemolytica]|uniref:DNA mismatch repair protein MutL n=2 Tax=Mannheimia haemolytica TaxID=75985 RepID=A0A547ELY5_MANHA|nr:DNA mismatch repair endonuclease MutL [Mannheimia haemolytica]AWW70562.1 DNA mismatch repair endonuclease MutL [Pasteurellaceae bacterium 12565]AGI31622.1 DNA mismatch repair endonuclease MutL [Mannheimia haemolytica USDA-ARS-USMARC-183]AGI36270.1 DNA mismatch repair endonuclease MutL [Mannheimia haemolytica USDA-ARS-USMARC-185]AGK00739.1 DNA mismatch repair protein MutL [Mannheimia haemolytica M42548]AGQ25592.1 DNA mismatch repair protein MutL [Mannheimia haemolytica D153]